MDSIIWLGRSAKYLSVKNDEGFENEFNLILKYWKTGKL